MQPTATPAIGYVNKADLAAEIAAYHQSGTASESLGAMLLAIAGGVWDRFRSLPDRDEFVGEIVIHFLTGPLHKANPEQNCFAFLTTCAVRYGAKLRDRSEAEQRRWASYRQAVLDANRIFGFESRDRAIRRQQAETEW
jgi:hypothetical protein